MHILLCCRCKIRSPLLQERNVAIRCRQANNISVYTSEYWYNRDKLCEVAYVVDLCLCKVCIGNAAGNVR